MEETLAFISNLIPSSFPLCDLCVLCGSKLRGCRHSLVAFPRLRVGLAERTPLSHRHEVVVVQQDVHQVLPGTLLGIWGRRDGGRFACGKRRQAGGGEPMGLRREELQTFALFLTGWRS